MEVECTKDSRRCWNIQAYANATALMTINNARLEQRICERSLAVALLKEVQLQALAAILARTGARGRAGAERLIRRS